MVKMDDLRDINTIHIDIHIYINGIYPNHIKYHGGSILARILLTGSLSMTTSDCKPLGTINISFPRSAA